MCRVDCCLLLSNMAIGVSAAAITALCSKYGSVDSVHVGPSVAAQLGAGEAFVVFETVRQVC